MSCLLLTLPCQPPVCSYPFRNEGDEVIVRAAVHRWMEPGLDAVSCLLGTGVGALVSLVDAGQGVQGCTGSALSSVHSRECPCCIQARLYLHTISILGALLSAASLKLKTFWVWGVGGPAAGRRHLPVLLLSVSLVLGAALATACLLRINLGPLLNWTVFLCWSSSSLF